MSSFTQGPPHLDQHNVYIKKNLQEGREILFGDLLWDNDFKEFPLSS